MTEGDVKVEIAEPIEKAEESPESKAMDVKKKGPRKFSKEFYEERRRAWEESQKLKEVLETEVLGKVKWYSVTGRYGFIERSDGKGDVFVHQSVIAKSKVEKYHLRTLDADEEVKFDIVKGNKGQEASNVTGPNGEEVRGSKYYRILLRKFHPKKPRKRTNFKKNGEKQSLKKEGEEEKKENNNAEKPKKKRAYRRPRVVNRKPHNVDDLDSSTKSEDKETQKDGRRHGASKSAAGDCALSDSGNVSLGTASHVDAQALVGFKPKAYKTVQ